MIHVFQWNGSEWIHVNVFPVRRYTWEDQFNGLEQFCRHNPDFDFVVW